MGALGTVVDHAGAMVAGSFACGIAALLPASWVGDMFYVLFYFLFMGILAACILLLIAAVVAAPLVGLAWLIHELTKPEAPASRGFVPPDVPLPPASFNPYRQIDARSNRYMDDARDLLLGR